MYTPEQMKSLVRSVPTTGMKDLSGSVVSMAIKKPLGPIRSSDLFPLRTLFSSFGYLLISFFAKTFKLFRKNS